MTLPSGTVTFLFTDIEGSTRLVRELRERWGDVLAEHQLLLRTAFAEHGGYEVDTQGDSFFVAFASARQALLAAVDGQRALVDHDWPNGVRIAVRMGIHTGRAVATGGSYHGLAVHRAARISAAGHGGQVLVSHATQTLLEDEEEDDFQVVLRDLGEQRLKDFDRPVRLYQAEADGLPTSFPALRPAAELAHAAEAAVAGPPWRRPALVAAVLLALAALAIAVVLATRDSGGALDSVRPNHVGAIDPETNTVVAEAPVGIEPGPVVAEGGSVWVGNLQDRTLTRVDPRTRTAAGTVALGNRTPTGLAVGLGAVWVAHGRLGELSRVEPQFGQVNTVKISGEALGSVNGSVTVGSGSVWAAYGDSTVARVRASPVSVLGVAFAGAAPSAIVVANRSVWVANGDDATVFRYNAATFEQGRIGTISVGRRPTAIAAGEGAIWVAATGDDAVTRIDPSTYSTTSIPVGDGPVAVAVGAGSVWVANAGSRTVSRIDPATNEVVETIEIGSVPAGIAVGGGLVWVTAQTP